MTTAPPKPGFSEHGFSGRRIFVTGAAGFIGFHLCRRLLAAGAIVHGIDNFSSYYDVRLKERRNALLEAMPGYHCTRAPLEDLSAFSEAWEQARPEGVVHLAAQAGVRHSIDHPEDYISANLIGTFHVLELARRFKVGHLLCASTSSAYGANETMPFVETDKFAHPLTLYAATKGATELMGHSYANIHRIPITFFRFFTVYGPWGRPDMALFKFVDAMIKGEAIDVYNNGDMKRDFTFVDDLVEGIVRLIDAPPLGPPVEGDSLSPVAPYRLVNIGGGNMTNLVDYISAAEEALGVTATRNLMPMQAGDVPATYANTDLLERLTGFRPNTSVRVGVRAFVEWYRAYLEGRDQ